LAVIRMSTTSTLPVSIGIPHFRRLKGGSALRWSFDATSG
jgi:hypothetical protein